MLLKTIKFRQNSISFPLMKSNPREIENIEHNLQGSVKMTIKKLKQIDISGFRLVLSTVSIGNVGQLAADLFVESLNMEKFAIVIYF